jgi:CheY-like chemotaxis protein
VTVATGRRGEEVFIRVEDNGAGIPPEIMPRLFDPFFTTKKAGEGSGLGLSICQDIALKHRGRIEVKSDPGQGSAFTLLIPLETGLGTRAPEKEAAKTGAAGLNRRPRLLVVDDEKEVLKSLVRVFRDDYFLVTAASAQEALQILETDRRFDLILTDLIMPGLNGKALFELATGRWPELDPLFVFFTGGAYDASLKEFVAGKQDRTVHKPLGGEEIKTVIRQRLARPDAPAERPRP